MKRSVVVVWCLGLVACGGEGTVEVTLYGEEFVEEGIPASATQDGWSVTFDRFEVEVRDVTIAGEAIDDAGAIDITQASEGRGHLLGSVRVPDGSYRDASFTVARVALAGAFDKDAIRKTFDWEFDTATRYHECEGKVAVEPDERETFQITIHADHFFYDSLVAMEPMLLMGPLVAADLNDDGAIDQAELSQTDIGSYDPGNEDIDDLWSWLNVAGRTVGHANGEGHCHAEPAIAD